MNSVKVALVQDTPVLFNLEATLNKVNELISKAAQQKPQLILFPEAFISVYPRGLGFGTVVGSRSKAGRELWLDYWQSAIEVPSKETIVLGQMAKAANSFLAIGVTEKDAVSKSLYCTLLYFSDKGELIGKHRKLKPTAAERIIWAEGDGSGLLSFDTKMGKIGGLICWENYMPLARMAMYSKGVEIYLAPTADSRESWQASMKHIAMEGRCFVLTCNQFVRKEEYPQKYSIEISDAPDILCSGGSAIYSPMGELIAGPVYDKATILYAVLDKDEIIKAKMDFDPIGHYARPDVFKLKIKGMPKIKKIK